MGCDGSSVLACSGIHSRWQRSGVPRQRDSERVRRLRLLLTFYEKELHRLFDDSERISDDTVFAGKTMIILYSSVLGVLGVVPDFGLVGLKEAVSRRTGFPRCSFDRNGECLPDR